MTEEVLFRGEWVDKSLVNLWLSNPENQRILEEEQEAVKKQHAREREQERRHKKKKAESDKEKAAEYFHKYRQEIGPDVTISDEYAQMLWRRAYNAVEYDRRYEEERKQQEEWHRQMEQKEKQDRERKERELKQRHEYRKNLPRQQLDMILSGRRNIWGCCGRRKEAVVDGHSLLCKITRVESLEPGLSLLREEINSGKIIRLDERTCNRMVEFARPNETYPDLINRLLDIAAKTAVTAETNDLK
jgi:hypothetical protein